MFEISQTRIRANINYVSWIGNTFLKYISFVFAVLAHRAEVLQIAIFFETEDATARLVRRVLTHLQKQKTQKIWFPKRAEIYAKHILTNHNFPSMASSARAICILFKSGNDITKCGFPKLDQDMNILNSGTLILKVDFVD